MGLSIYDEAFDIEDVFDELEQRSVCKASRTTSKVSY